jgi:DNA invertase Pin-like site-specific DNA recombinase
LAAQQEALKAAGADQVYAEKISGAKADRPALQRLLKRLGEGDTLLVTRLDRLARSTRDLLNILDQVSSAGATFKSLADAWADTTTPHGRLIITVLAGLAAYERELIRARTGEGRKRARERVQHLGRPFKLTLHQRREAKARYDNGETLVDIGRSLNVAHTTVARAIELGDSRQ